MSVTTEAKTKPATKRANKTAEPVGPAMAVEAAITPPPKLRRRPLLVDVMSQQSTRQAARRSALEAQLARRRARAERERRLERLAVDVLVAVSERDASIQAAERRAGHALRAMTDREGLSLREVVEWCGGEITMRDAMRMRRLVSDP